uniref:Glycerophosphoinositol inositolphosphodiesterase GDPD2-like n=1 Tax=Sinocyclocheilus grahami TaxID=75366 RepID=A0A672NZA8_SINGR
KWVNWYMIVMVVSAVLATYCLLLLVRRENVIQLVVWLVACNGCTNEFILLFQVFGLLHLAVREPLDLHWLHKVFIMLTFLVVSAAVFLCPLAICSPCIANNLPPKPALVGHRGAPMLAPENTMLSFRKSMECGVVAFETDVQLSKDMKPFLMHDNGPSFLLRTTDVKEKFLGRDADMHANFTLQALQTLNAGEWFVRTDPFQSVSSLSKEEKREANNQSVPSLSELLVMAKKHNVSLIFDLKNEKNSTGFHNSDSYYTAETIEKSGISPDKVILLYGGIQKSLNLIELHFQNELRKNNVSVNLWVVNERWLFSLLWCSGASSVTTNACHILKSMSKPDWHLEPNMYMGIWVSADVISLLLMFGLFLWQK